MLSNLIYETVFATVREKHTLCYLQNLCVRQQYNPNGQQQHFPQHPHVSAKASSSSPSSSLTYTHIQTMKTSGLHTVNVWYSLFHASHLLRRPKLYSTTGRITSMAPSTDWCFGKHPVLQTAMFLTCLSKKVLVWHSDCHTTWGLTKMQRYILNNFKHVFLQWFRHSKLSDSIWLDKHHQTRA